MQIIKPNVTDAVVPEQDFSKTNLFGSFLAGLNQQRADDKLLATELMRQWDAQWKDKMHLLVNMDDSDPAKTAAKKGLLGALEVWNKASGGKRSPAELMQMADGIFSSGAAGALTTGQQIDVANQFGKSATQSATQPELINKQDVSLAAQPPPAKPSLPSQSSAPSQPSSDFSPSLTSSSLDELRKAPMPLKDILQVLANPAATEQDIKNGKDLLREQHGLSYADTIVQVLKSTSPEFVMASIEDAQKLANSKTPSQMPSIDPAVVNAARQTNAPLQSAIAGKLPPYGATPQQQAMHSPPSSQLPYRPQEEKFGWQEPVAKPTKVQSIDNSTGFFNTRDPNEFIIFNPKERVPQLRQEFETIMPQQSSPGGWAKLTKAIGDVSKALARPKASGVRELEIVEEALKSAVKLEPMSRADRQATVSKLMKMSPDELAIRGFTSAADIKYRREEFDRQLEFNQSKLEAELIKALGQTEGLSDLAKLMNKNAIDGANKLISSYGEDIKRVIENPAIMGDLFQGNPELKLKWQIYNMLKSDVLYEATGKNTVFGQNFKVIQVTDPKAIAEFRAKFMPSMMTLSEAQNYSLIDNLAGKVSQTNTGFTSTQPAKPQMTADDFINSNLGKAAPAGKPIVTTPYPTPNTAWGTK
jgi:hypothetical protein